MAGDRAMGTMGYCMGGSMTMRTAAWRSPTESVPGVDESFFPVIATAANLERYLGVPADRPSRGS